MLVCSCCIRERSCAFACRCWWIFSDRTKMFGEDLWRVKYECSRAHTHTHIIIKHDKLMCNRSDNANVSKSQLNLLLFVRCASMCKLCLRVSRLELSTNKLSEEICDARRLGCVDAAHLWCANTLKMCKTLKDWQKNLVCECVCVRWAHIGTYAIMLYCALCNRNRGTFVEICQLTISGCGKRCVQQTKTWTELEHTYSMQFEGVLSQKVKLYLNFTRTFITWLRIFHIYLYLRSMKMHPYERWVHVGSAPYLFESKIYLCLSFIGYRV